MLTNIQYNPHTVTIRFISVRAVANSCSRRLFCEYADRYTCAVAGVPMVYVYGLSVLGRERKKGRCPQYKTYGDQQSTTVNTRVLCISSIWGFRSDSFLKNMSSTSVKRKVMNKGLPPVTEQFHLENTTLMLSVTID